LSLLWRFQPIRRIDKLLAIELAAGELAPALLLAQRLVELVPSAHNRMVLAHVAEWNGQPMRWRTPATQARRCNKAGYATSNGSHLLRRDWVERLMAIKRHGSADEVAGVVAWLAGPEAGCVTGAMHTIDGAFGAGPIPLSAHSVRYRSATRVSRSRQAAQGGDRPA
jgi:hypothetical protein